MKHCQRQNILAETMRLQHIHIGTFAMTYESEHQAIGMNNNQTLLLILKHTVLLDMAVQTDRHISANRPDIIIKDKVNSTSKLIDDCTL